MSFLIYLLSFSTVGIWVNYFAMVWTDKFVSEALFGLFIGKAIVTILAMVLIHNLLNAGDF